MADSLSLTVAVTGAENVSIPVTQPGTVLSTLPSVGAPMFAFAQTLLPPAGAFSMQRLQFTPGSFQLVVNVSALRGMLLVDDPAFLGNTSLQVGVYHRTLLQLYGAVGCGNPFTPYASVPVPWPTVFTIAAGATQVIVRTESSVNVAQAPSAAFGATLFTW